ncbi:MAG: RecX family transcriptional regulator, partial [Longicatena sp.]
TETQGMTYIESLACGLPVFARPDDVLKDLVVENDSGFLFQSPQEFAKKLMDFMKLPKEEQLAFHGRAISKIAKYDSKVFYSKVISVYYQAIDDFQDAYEVIKVKALDDYVRIYVMNEKEDEPKKILIDLDDYFLYKIRVHTMLDRMTVSLFEQKEILLEAYRGAIRRLRMRDYTRKEMKQYFYKYPSLSEEDKDKIIHELEEKGYINDTLYMSQKIEKMQYSLTGKGNIRRTLINKGIPAEEVDQALADFGDDEEREKAVKMAEKLLMTIKDKSSKMKKQTIIQKLINLGFDSDIAKTTGDTLRLDEEDDSEALDKTIQKAMRSYMRKYASRELRGRILAHCMRKGFNTADINDKLNEMEWNDHNEN